ncbi:pyruvate formate-lyase-activating protein [Pontiella agarivorans]|uniref:Pyruvate formate-lyase-activating enzyme n=1 Tax=Pontiella agarivorans TaxID=3038953 RepID=A0ABU5MUT5_9BACT|nr:pyruvate formate-lyase-activating protein [Pontiella agarivorans]MDZ8117716.1 pyruvate formate-lyase-activating protein [Pontiella agarivorans]
MTLQEAREVRGRISTFESCGTVDGPGLRTVVFMQGCPLRCLYCHNPETWEFGGGDECTAGEVFDEISKYRNFWKTSGGGVTFSGGEPMSRPRFLEALLMLCREEGIHTVVDTSGFTLITETVRRIVELTDLFLLDIKSVNANMHQIITGESNKNTMAFAEYLASVAKPVWMRYVIVPRLNDRVHCLEKMAKWARAQGNIEKVELLPFHKMGEWKWKKYELPYRLSETWEPGAEEVKQYADIFRAEGLVVD